jgi:biopolymer transport protein ExbD
VRLALACLVTLTAATIAASEEPNNCSAIDKMPLGLVVTTDGRVRFGGTPVALDALASTIRAAIEQRPESADLVYFCAENSVSSEAERRVMQIAQDAGVRKVHFIVLPASASVSGADQSPNRR